MSMNIHCLGSVKHSMTWDHLKSAKLNEHSEGGIGSSLTSGLSTGLVQSDPLQGNVLFLLGQEARASRVTGEDEDHRDRTADGTTGHRISWEVSSDDDPLTSTRRPRR